MLEGTYFSDMPNVLISMVSPLVPVKATPILGGGENRGSTQKQDYKDSKMLTFKHFYLWFFVWKQQFIHSLSDSYWSHGQLLDTVYGNCSYFRKMARHS